MLKKLRSKKTAKKIWIILAIIIVPAFVLWGSGSLIRNKEEAAFAGIIFGKKISFLEYKDSLDAVKNAAIMQLGDKFPEMRQYLNLERQAWDRLILLYEAKRRNIKATDREVIELIESYPFFKRNGQFDNRLYSETLQYAFHTKPRMFEEQTRQNIILSKLFERVTKEVKLEENEIKEEYAKLNEEISIFFIASLPSDFTKNLNPQEQDLKDYFGKFALQFKQPLSFNMDYIILESEDKAKDVALRLKKSKDLQNLAKDLGIAVKETGLFSQTDPIPGIGWSPEISNLIAKLNVGQFSPPIHLDKNYYILRLKERKDAYIPNFEKIRVSVREMFIKNESEKIAKEKIASCLEKLKALYRESPRLIDFNKAAKEYGLKSDSTNSFKYGSYIEGVGASDSFWLAAQKLKGDEFSDIIATPAGFYIIKLKSKVPVDEKKFESENTEFSNKVLAQKQQAYFAKFIEDLSRKSGIPY